MQAKGRQFGRTWRRRGWGTHVYMHCIAKTLLTELHLAILVPLLCLRNSPSAPTFSVIPVLSLAPSPPPSLFHTLRDTGRVSTYAKSYSIRLREIPYDGGELMARLMVWEAVGRCGRVAEGPEGIGGGRGGRARWGWIPRVGERHP